MTASGSIVIEGLRKRYEHGRPAVDGLDLVVPGGTVHALLGPNGAGKTTTVRILATLLAPDSGHVLVAGANLRTHPHLVRERIGLCGQHAALDHRLTGRENLHMLGRLAGLSRAAARERTGELAERLRLADFAGKTVADMSGGMARRIDLAAAFLARPRVLFLDEPTTGFDPVARLDVWELVGELVAAGTTVLLTTQHLDEAERLADAVSVLRDGRLIANGTPGELKRQAGGPRLEIVLRHPDQRRPVLSVLETLALSGITTGDRAIVAHLAATDPLALLGTAVRALASAGVEVEELALRRPSLEDVFVALTSEPRKHRQEERSFT
ncbi:ATP-binding cassette domain-containing protein [Nonomuraea fuscirosea]|uniref:ATP-binding cassette domain-containing protein n=1 Tax=Nonomuraea fuscirosea TaxID=1291556 RepID=UPI0034444876